MTGGNITGEKKYDKLDYDRDGFNRQGFDKDGYNRYGVDKYGYPRRSSNNESYNREENPRDGYDKDGYDKDGYDKDGYDKDGYDKDGYDKDGYDKDGYNRKGYNIHGFNRDGYNESGYNQAGFDKDGYNRYGVDKYGYPRRSSNNERYSHSDITEEENTKQEFSERPVGVKKGIKRPRAILAGLVSLVLFLLIIVPFIAFFGTILLLYYTILEDNGYSILTLSPIIIIVSWTIHHFKNKWKDEACRKEKNEALERERKVIQEMYASGKTDSDVAEYLDKLGRRERFQGQDLIWCCYNPYYNWSLENSERYIANSDERCEARRWRNEVRKKYPQAYQNHDENDEKASKFRYRVACYVARMQGQTPAVSYSSSNTSNNIDWEKAATGTVIFGPTGVALGMTDDKDKH